MLIFSFLVITFSALSQDKVRWDVIYNNEEQSVEFKATIEKGWHLYSQHVNQDVGPVPTSFNFNVNERIKLIGNTDEPKPIQAYDPNFEGDVSYFEGNVIFTQKIRPSKGTDLSGTITYMLCNDVMCLPPKDKEFSIRID